MLYKNAVVAVLDQHTQTELVVENLQHAGFDMTMLSVVAKGKHSDEGVVAYYTLDDQMQYWGENGVFWRGVWGLLDRAGIFFIPGIGPLVAAGPIVGWIVEAIEEPPVVDGISAFGAGLYSVGIPKGRILHYENSIKNGRFVLVVDGSPDQVTHARTILSGACDCETELYIAGAPLIAVG
jgi:hypothetical protein